MSINAIGSQQPSYLDAHLEQLRQQIRQNNTTTQNVFNNNNNQIKADSFNATNNNQTNLPADGVDDGKISLGSMLKNFGKGLISPITSMFSSVKNFAIGAGMIAGGALLTVATGGAILPLFVAGGVGFGAIQLGTGAYKATTAKTDAEAENAWQGIGAGASAIGLSVLGAKSSLKASDIDTSKMNCLEATFECFKQTPNSISKSFSAIGSKSVAGMKNTANVKSEKATTKKSTSTAKKLAEHIDFKKATTVEEAIAYGRDNLGIENYSGFESTDIDTLNWVNEGMTNINNTFKGKATFPKNVKYAVKDYDTLASVSDDKTTLYINKNIYKNLDKTIQKLINGTKGSEGEPGLYLNSETGEFGVPIEISGTDFQSVKPFLQEILDFQQGKLTTYDQKLQLLSDFNRLDEAASIVYGGTDTNFARIFSIPGVKGILNKAGISTDLTAISKLNPNQKNDLIMKVLTVCAEEGKPVGVQFEQASKFHTIYHELGHLNDPNLKSHVFAEYHHYKTPEKIQQLHDWVNDTSKMEAAGSVSSYAQSDEAEFFADVMAKLCNGEKVSDKAMTLFQQLGGNVQS